MRFIQQNIAFYKKIIHNSYYTISCITFYFVQSLQSMLFGESLYIMHSLKYLAHVYFNINL